MKHRIGMTIVVCAAALLPSATQGMGAHADRVWALPVGAYPPHTQLATDGASTARVQSVFAVLHRRTYAQIGRVDGRGWIQYGRLNTTSEELQGQHVKRTQQKYFWGYAVSYFKREADVKTAIADLRGPLKLLKIGVFRAETYTTSSAGKYAILYAFGAGHMLVELVGSVTAKVTQPHRAFLTASSSRLAQKLVGVLLRLANAPPRARPTSTSVPGARATPTPLPEPTP